MDFRRNRWGVGVACGVAALLLTGCGPKETDPRDALNLKAPPPRADTKAPVSQDEMKARIQQYRQRSVGVPPPPR